MQHEAFASCCSVSNELSESIQAYCIFTSQSYRSVTSESTGYSDAYRLLVCDFVTEPDLFLPIAQKVHHQDDETAAERGF